VELCSALENTGMDKVWKDIESFCALMREDGAFEARRTAQARAWMWKMIEEHLRESFRKSPGVKAMLAETEKEVALGKLTPATAAEKLLAKFFREKA
jgi:LAO/AO transport system kinase